MYYFFQTVYVIISLAVTNIFLELIIHFQNIKIANKL